MEVIGLEEDIIGMEPEEKLENKDNEGDDKDKFKGMVIDTANIPPLTEDDIKFLKGVKIRNNNQIIYMQPDISYYDMMYNIKDDDSKEMQILKNVMGLKRRYSVYTEYLDALDTIKEYIRTFIYDKYGGEDIFNIYYSLDNISIWKPPIPRFNKNSEEYDNYLLGMPMKPTTTDNQKKIMDLNKEIANLTNLINSYELGDDLLTQPKYNSEVFYDHNMITQIQEAQSKVHDFLHEVNGNIVLDDIFRDWTLGQLVEPNEEKEDTANDAKKLFSHTKEYYRDHSKDIQTFSDDSILKLDDEDFDVVEWLVKNVYNKNDTPVIDDDKKQANVLKYLTSLGWSEYPLLVEFGNDNKYIRNRNIVKFVENFNKKHKSSYKSSDNKFNVDRYFGTF